MNVGELRELLKDIPEDTEIRVDFDLEPDSTDPDTLVEGEIVHGEAETEGERKFFVLEVLAFEDEPAGD